MGSREGGILWGVRSAWRITRRIMPRTPTRRVLAVLIYAGMAPSALLLLGSILSGVPDPGAAAALEHPVVRYPFWALTGFALLYAWQLASRIKSQRLGRDKPLWEMWVIERL